MIQSVILQHADSTTFLYLQRNALITSPHVNLSHIERHDARLAANLDGLIVAGPDGWKTCMSLLDNPGIGEIFATSVLAVESQNIQHFK